MYLFIVFICIEKCCDNLILLIYNNSLFENNIKFEN